MITDTDIYLRWYREIDKITTNILQNWIFIYINTVFSTLIHFLGAKIKNLWDIMPMWYKFYILTLAYHSDPFINKILGKKEKNDYLLDKLFCTKQSIMSLLNGLFFQV